MEKDLVVKLLLLVTKVVQIAEIVETAVNGKVVVIVECVQQVMDVLHHITGKSNNYK